MANRTHMNSTNKRGGRLYSGASAPHGCVLLYGPPGCGKTHFLRSTGNEFKLATEFISCRELRDGFMEGVKTQLFFKKLFSRARESAPSMVILDDIDAITSMKSLKDLKVRKGVYQLLRELDSIKPGDRILITATSDRPYLIEPLLFKARRFDKLIFVPLPNPESREALFELYLQNYTVSGDINYKSLNRITRGFNGQDIKSVVGYANELAIEDNSNITMHHLESAVKEVGPSLTHEVLDPIKQFFMRYKSGTLWQYEATGKPKKDRGLKRKDLGKPKKERKPKPSEEKVEKLVFELDEGEIELEEVTEPPKGEEVEWSFDEDDTEKIKGKAEKERKKPEKKEKEEPDEFKKLFDAYDEDADE